MNKNVIYTGQNTPGFCHSFSCIIEFQLSPFFGSKSGIVEYYCAGEVEMALVAGFSDKHVSGKLPTAFEGG